MSDSTSSSTSFVLILLLLGGGVWMVKQSLEPQPKAAPAAAVEEVEEAESTTYSRAVDFSQTNGEAMNNSMSDQLKSVQQMTGGTYDGQTYVLPGGRK